jgi:hypothetical protein
MACRWNDEAEEEEEEVTAVVSGTQWDFMESSAEPSSSEGLLSGGRLWSGSLIFVD